jgi:hypothetical protein
MKVTKLLLATTVLAICVGCSGMRKTDHAFYTHAESFRVLGYSIPGDDQARARVLVPGDAEITSVRSTPADWTSLLGILGNILWIHQTEIGGTVAAK